MIELCLRSQINLYTSSKVNVQDSLSHGVISSHLSISFLPRKYEHKHARTVVTGDRYFVDGHIRWTESLST